MAALDRKCLNTALRLLGRRDHSCRELSLKLTQRGFDQEQIALVVDECIRLKYLDDEKFSHLVTRQLRRKGYGALRISQMLKNKGISSGMIDAVVDQHCKHAVQLQECIDVLNKKLKSNPSAQKTNRERLHRFLANRGFAFDVIREAFRTHVPEDL